MSDQEEEIQDEAEQQSLAEFLEGTPPGSERSISELAKSTRYSGGGYAGHKFVAPEIQLHCGSDSCGGLRFFRRIGADDLAVIPDDKWQFFYVTYKCSNCLKTQKTFSLAARRDAGADSGNCYKFGELPEYGPPTPARLIKLIGPDRDLFLRGRRCENQGLGVGAFVYYRRVVENQKNRILDEVIKVATKLGAQPASLRELDAAKKETQFSKAVAGVRHAMPQALLINGHNPLTLLHGALSDGLHDRDDSHCLELATSVRVVLAELSERLSQALKDEAELNRALASLMRRGDV